MLIIKHSVNFWIHLFVRYKKIIHINQYTQQTIFTKWAKLKLFYYFWVSLVGHNIYEINANYIFILFYYYIFCIIQCISNGQSYSHRFLHSPKHLTTIYKRVNF